MKAKTFSNKKKSIIASHSGQVVVEYVLLLIVLVTIATIIVGGLTGRNGSPGVVLTSWNGILTTIAQDIPDRVVPK